jgi:hypothetical protein
MNACLAPGLVAGDFRLYLLVNLIKLLIGKFALVCDLLPKYRFTLISIPIGPE